MVPPPFIRSYFTWYRFHILSEVFCFSFIDMSSRRVGLRESKRIRGRNGSVGVERIRSGDVSEALTEVLREET